MSKLAELKSKIVHFKKRVEDKLEATNKQIEEADKVLESLGPLTKTLEKVSDIAGNPTPQAPKAQERKLGPRQGPCNLMESAPVGSFDRVSDDLRAALSESKKVLFPDLVDPYPWVSYVFPEHCIVTLNNKYYEIAYTMDMNGKVTWGKPIEVEQMYTSKVVESTRVEKTGKTFSQEVKEAGIELVGQSQDADLDVSEFYSLKEAKYDSVSGELEVVLIEAGTNPLKKRHYPESTIRESAAHFKGLKMYLNHPTKKEEAERPERDLRDWASTIVESWYDDGKAMGRVVVHDEWLRERLMDPVARQHIGVSINTGGKIVMGKVNGEEMQIVEKISLRRSNGPASVDWVTEAGARGRVSRLLKESQTLTKEKTMDLKEATFADLQRENPTLVKELSESIRKELSQSDEMKAKDAQLKEAQEKLAAVELKEKQTAQDAKVSEWLRESKLPTAVQDRIKLKVAEKVFADEKELRECFDGAHKAEVEYINKISPKGKISLGAPAGKSAGEGSSLRESSAKAIADRLHLGEEKDEDQE